MKFTSMIPFLQLLAVLATPAKADGSADPISREEHLQQFLRGLDVDRDDANLNQEDASPSTRLLRQLLQVDEDKIKQGLRDGLSKSIGFGAPITPRPNDDKINGNTGGRKLSSGNYTFTPCSTVNPNERQCDTVIKTFTKDALKQELDTILSAIINVDGCLDQYSDYYGLCGVDYPCVCPTFANPFACIGFCLAPVCPDACYANSLEPTWVFPPFLYLAYELA